MGETYYELLEVEPDASRAEIRTAYRERVLETHPDHNDAPDAADQFARVSTARSVLTDGTERARYDRLGHDAYVRLAEGLSDSSSADASSAASSETDAAHVSDDSTGRTARDSSSRTTRSGTETAANRSGSTASRRRADGTTAGGDGRGRTSRTRSSTAHTRAKTRSSHRSRAGSHYARQRARRQRETARGGSARWSFDTDDGRASSTAPGTAATSSDSTAESASEFRYAVHDWEGDVDLEWEGRPVDHATALTFGCCWLLYPVFVAASLTSMFPLAINAVVAACTLGIVGYLLTRPRIATGLFGFWSLVFPLGIAQLSAVPSVSITGLLALGFAWIPFGYAVALWWALRP